MKFKTAEFCYTQEVCGEEEQLIIIAEHDGNRTRLTMNTDGWHFTDPKDLWYVLADAFRRAVPR